MMRLRWSSSLMALCLLATLMINAERVSAQDSDEQTSIAPVEDEFASEIDETSEESSEEDNANGPEELVQPDDGPILIDPVVPPQPPLPPPEPPSDGVQTCGEALTGESGRFITPNFPEKYKSKSNCTWNITVEEGKRVQLTFHLFSVEHNVNCIWDWVKVLDTNGTLLKYFCGYLQQDLVLTSSGNNITIQFFTDGVVESSGFLASWKTVSGNESEAKPDENKEGYVLTFPQTFTKAKDSSDEPVCLQLFSVQETGSLQVGLYSTDSIVNGTPVSKIEFEYEPEAGEDIQCRRLSLPKDFSSSAAVLEAKGQFGEYSILSYKSVRALQLSPLVLVQTDKSDYRPGQVVRIRVLILDYELKPSSQELIKEIYIKNPLDSRLAQFKDVELKKGVAQREWTLPEEPDLGQWEIVVQPFEERDEETLAKFTVSESVLPKFEVTVAPPDYIIFDQDEAVFKVCAAYTHGGQLKGEANATFFVEYKENYWRAPLKRVEYNANTTSLDDKGCSEFSVPREEIKTLGTKGDIQMIAVVTEGVTGTQQNNTVSAKVHNVPFTIDTSAGSEEHIVGSGFPYVAEVRVKRHDGSPVTAEPIQVCVRLFTDVDELRNSVNRISHQFYTYTEDQFLKLAEKIMGIRMAETCQVLTTSEDTGSIKVAVPLESTIPQNVTKLSIKLNAVNQESNDTIGMIQPESKLDVALTHSNISSALSVYTDENPRMTCNGNKIKLFFAAVPESTFELSYYVSSGGALLDQGFEAVEVGSENLYEDFIGDATVMRFEENWNQETDEESPETIVRSHEFEIKRPFAEEGRVAKTIHLLVYTRSQDGQTLSASREFTADSCAEQPVIKWSAEKLNPGDKVSLSIDGESEAFCGYSIVDKSVDLIPNPNKITTPRVQELKEDIASKRIVSGDDSRRQKKCINEASHLFQAFEKIGLYVISDQLTDDISCDNLIDATIKEKNREEGQFDGPVAQHFVADDVAQFSARPQLGIRRRAGQPTTTTTPSPFTFSAGAPPRPQPIQDSEFAESSAPVTEVEQNKVELRNYFPETWLFNMIDLDVEGKASLDLEAPHTITTWIAEVFCSDHDSGLEISNATRLLVTQDFFADINLPYSVKRGEILPVNVSVFNNVDRGLPMKLSIRESESYKLDRMSRSVCLASRDNEIKTFSVKAKDLHEVNITVEAKITDELELEEGQTCNEAAGNAEGYTDVLQKPIQVKPEGFPVEKVQSVFQCNGPDQENEEIVFEPLALPENLVEGSDRGWVMATGDIMAPALANLENLVTMPYGCGEQNMITMAPNVYLMDYLQGTGKKEPELEATAKRYMKAGFDREQEFRHEDGSYSVWGPQQDDEGSTWLTAFVLKVFSQASRFIDIPRNNLQQSVDWLLRSQNKDGCFEPKGYVIHKNLAGTNESVTATVLLTLLEMKNNNPKIRIPPPALEQALICLDSIPEDKLNEPYLNALTTYVINLKNKVAPDTKPDLVEKAQKLTEDILASANTSTPGQSFWSLDDENNRARSVEITAYNVLSLVLQNKIPEALKAVRWLATQRNSKGGFVSTQDTMIALQAISQYSLEVSQDDNDLVVKIVEDGTDIAHEFSVNEYNELLLQSQKLSSLPAKLSIAIEGQGCFMVQSLVRYNVKDSPVKNSFDLKTEQKSESELNICSAYTGPKESTDMVVIEIELLSGFGVNPVSLESLQNQVEAPVKKYEYDAEKGNVVLYFDSMPKSESCWTIETKREVQIDELKPAIVKIYDYYNTEDEVSVEYNLN